VKKINYKKVRKLQPNNFEYTGRHKSVPVEMQLFVYNESKYEELKNVGYEQAVRRCVANTGTEEVKWLNVHGLHNTELIRNIGESLNVQSYIIDDILNTSRRTRVEDLDEVLFFSVKSVLPEEEEGSVKTEQISFLLKDDQLISFQEKKSDYFTHIRERIRTGTGVIRKRKNDYLLFLMLDAIMENFFITIEKFEGSIEELATEAKKNYKADIIAKVEKLRENLSYLKRSVLPLRDALYNLKDIEDDDQYEGIHKTSRAYFARLYQKSLELLDQVDYDLNSLESVSNYHYSAQSQRMNQIMKTLTIFSVIFMPITFIVGVYGMNFDNMPELHSQNGYYYALGAMALITVVMVIYFKVKDWF
jgi:magnesium transporter